MGKSWSAYEKRLEGTKEKQRERKKKSEEWIINSRISLPFDSNSKREFSSEKGCEKTPSVWKQERCRELSGKIPIESIEWRKRKLATVFDGMRALSDEANLGLTQNHRCLDKGFSPSKTPLETDGRLANLEEIF